MSATRTSGLFTQDLEDFAGFEVLPPETGQGEPTQIEAGRSTCAHTSRRVRIPVGPNAGKMVKELPSATLQKIASGCRDNNKYPGLVEAITQYDSDVFDGALDEPKMAAKESFVQTMGIAQEAAEAKAALDEILGPADGPKPTSKLDWLRAALEQCETVEELSALAANVSKAVGDGTLTAGQGQELLDAVDAKTQKINKPKRGAKK